MGESQIALFHGVFSRMIESFTPHVKNAFSSYFSELESSPEKSRIAFDDVFSNFPRKITAYSNVIKMLLKIVDINPSLFLNDILLIFKELVKEKTCQLLNSINKLYEDLTECHPDFYFSFCTVLLSDLINQIVVNYGVAGKGSHLIKRAFSLGTIEFACDTVRSMVLNQWAVILSIISEENFQDIAAQFDSLASINLTSAFILIKFLRMDINLSYSNEFLDEIVDILTNALQRRTITNEILLSVGYLVKTASMDHESQLSKIFEIGWSLKDEKTLKDGAYYLISSLFEKLPSLNNKVNSFYKNAIFAQTSHPENVKRSLNLFFQRILGVNYDPKLIFWEWGIRTRTPSLSYIQWGRDQSTKHDEFSKFMEYFFKKSDFSVCPFPFSRILLFFISADFDYFIENVLPKFLELNPNDNRFITFLMVFPLINSPDFINYSSNEVNSEKIQAFNSLVIPKIFESFHNLKVDGSIDAISIHDNEFEYEHLMEESDQYIFEILTQWKIQDFHEVNIVHMKSEKSMKTFSLEIQLLLSLHAIQQTGYNFSDETMLMLLKLTFSLNYQVANKALSICRKLCFDPAFIKVIVNYLHEVPSAEALFVCISILNDCFKQKPKFPKDILHDIELIGLIGLNSLNPGSRKFSYDLLSIVNNELKQNGFFSYIHPNLTRIEKIVKHKIFLHSIAENTRSQSKSTTGEIPFNTALLSHYFDIWMLFLSEIANIIVAANYDPIIVRIRNVFPKYIESNYPSMHIFYYASYFSKGDLLTNVKPLYNVQLFCPYDSHSDADTKSIVIRTLNDVLSSPNREKVFMIILHSHVTLLPIFIEILSTFPSDLINIATKTMAIALRNPCISSTFMIQLIPHILKFLAMVRGYIIASKINGPRVIRWSPELEQNVIQSQDLAINYCAIISQMFSHNIESISEDEWSLPTREIVFRFLINWLMTSSPELESLREYAAIVISEISQFGQLFTDTLLFDGSLIQLLTRLEQKGANILGPLLYNHADLVIENYIEACYTQQRNDASLFFESFFIILQESKIKDVKEFLGPLLLLGLVYYKMSHPRSEAYLCSLTQLITHNKANFLCEKIDAKANDNTMEKSEKTLYIKSLKTYKDKFFHVSLNKVFQNTTESVIEAAFKVLSLKNIHITPKLVIEAVKPWISNLRLLPKQQNCVPGIPSEYVCFTPYQFLERLMETTEIIDDGSLRSIASLWIELLKSPDHSEFIPPFLFQWRNNESKCRLLLELIKSKTPNIIQGLAIRCTFAFYYHSTSCTPKDFKNDLWFVPLIIEALKTESGEIAQHIPIIIHFALLFYNDNINCFKLLELLSQQFSIDLPDNIQSTEAYPSNISQLDIIIPIVSSFVDKLKPSSEEFLDMWGSEAIKWIFGCRSLKIAKISLAIYNRIGYPIEPRVLTGICKAVAFHIIESSNDTKGLNELVAQAFIFYNNNFQENEQFAFDFASAFLDCKIFVDSCLKGAAQLFMKSLSSKVTSARAWQCIIGIVRPLIAKLEKDSVSQQIFNLLIQTSSNHELMMIVAPVKAIMPHLFTSSRPYEELMKTTQEAVLCQALVHYSTMIETASTRLLNSIFKISTQIVEKVFNENDRASLAKIYKAALNNLSNCENAIEFVTIIAKNDPGVATKTIYEFYDWDRSLEDVCRGLGRLFTPDDALLPITDCSTIQSTYNLLNCDTIPKILPFSYQQDMIDGMMRVTKLLGKKRPFSIRQSIHGTRDSIMGSRSNIQLNEQNEILWKYEPLWTPTKLNINSHEFEMNLNSELFVSPLQFELADLSK